MRETPAQHRARTGAWPPASDVSVAGPVLGSVAGSVASPAPRPPLADEPCPTLYRDVGPQALSAFLDGTLARLSGPDAPCLFLRDATLPPYGASAPQFGLLVLLQPLSLGPWLSGQEGIWVAERDRMPAAGTLAAVPGDEPLAALDTRLVDVPDAAGLRETLGGARYDERLAAMREALRAYLEDWRSVERASRPLRAVLDGTSTPRRRELLAAMDVEGVTEKDLRAPWFHLSPARRDAVRPLLSSLAARIAPQREDA